MALLRRTLLGWGTQIASTAMQPAGNRTQMLAIRAQTDKESARRLTAILADLPGTLAIVARPSAHTAGLAFSLARGALFCAIRVIAIVSSHCLPFVSRKLNNALLIISLN